MDKVWIDFTGNLKGRIYYFQELNDAFVDAIALVLYLFEVINISSIETRFHKLYCPLHHDVPADIPLHRDIPLQIYLHRDSNYLNQ